MKKFALSSKKFYKNIPVLEKMRIKLALGTLLFFAGISSAFALSADISITKSTTVGFEENIERYEDLDISIAYQNIGPDPAEEVVLEDPYDNAYGWVWSLPEECENLGDKIRCDLGTLDVNESGTISYSAQIAGGASLGMTTTYANITAQTPDDVLFNNSAATRFRVVRSSRPKYFYYSFNRGNSVNRLADDSEDDGDTRTHLEKMADNVRPAFAAASASNEEEAEKEEEETPRVVSRKITRTISSVSPRATVSYVAPVISPAAGKTTAPVASFISPTRLSSSGASPLMIGGLSFVLAGILRRRMKKKK